jgi:dCTP deaminase
VILNDKEIKELAREGMIQPFVAEKIKKVSVTFGYPEKGDRSILSFGLGHFGYDLRLSKKDFKIFRHVPGTVINPKRFNPDNLVDSELQRDEDGEFFIIPGHSYALGVAVEKLEMPDSITAIAIGKSTYARTGLIVNVTPTEAGWKGHLTIEISNSSPADVRVYANEGILQLLFFQGNPCAVGYGDGKYQGQSEEIVLAKI